MSKRQGRCFGCRKRILSGEQVFQRDGYKMHLVPFCVVKGRKRKEAISARTAQAELLRGK